MHTLQDQTSRATQTLLQALWHETDTLRRKMLQAQIASEVPRQLSLRDMDRIAPTLM
ncbi:hypothetical protein [Tropicimonas sp. S265A]|uniref:hypothetical protein n=1 Tax=Tropicimonas sp. S265A TaxID=3415134 RepID=UPI003C7D0C55